MAHPKKNQMNQVLFLMVDSADFVTIKSALTNPPTGRTWGVTHGGSTAAASVAISKTISHVRSGIYRATIKAAENNFDFGMLRFVQPSCADQVIPWVLVDNDDSDIMSYLIALSGTLSDTYSLLSDHHSDFQSRVPKAVATNSQLSDLHSDLRSYLVGMSGMLSDVDSALTSQYTAGHPLTASDLSDLRSAIAAVTATVSASDISDIASAVWAHPLGVRLDSNMLLVLSQASDVYSLLSDVSSDLGVLSGVLSDTYSLLSDLRSDFQSRVPKAVATNSQLSDLHSDLRSYLVALSDQMSDLNSDLRSLVTTTGVALNASALSDVGSAVWGANYTTHGAGAGLFGSLMRRAASGVSDIYSLLSDVGSDLTVMSDVQSNILSLLSSLESDIQSRFPATIPELTGDPGATPTWAQAEALQFMWLKNNSKTTTSKRFLRNNAGTTVLSAPMGETANTSFTQGKLG